MKPTIDLTHKILMPQNPRPIAIIGAGGIVHDAHLPAYKKAGWNVFGIYDLSREKAENLAAEFNIGSVFTSIPEMIAQAPEDVVYDIAVPASVLSEVLELLPDGSVILMQKPMGENIAEANKILEICREKEFVAAVNFQMRFIPAVVAAKKLIESGALGELHDIEIKMNIYHPWHLWEFLFKIPRMEMLYHSIHYMDLMRYFFGNPKKVYAKTLKHPQMMQLASTRSMIILEYDDVIKSHIHTNHGHDFGLKHQESFIKFEGTKGAIKTTLGLNIDYPHGVPDTFEYITIEGNEEREWESFDFGASWFPDAFIGSMANVMCFAEGAEPILINAVESAYQTMELVEAAYESSDGGGTPIKYRYEL
jgi:predicted dehydrogenase